MKIYMNYGKDLGYMSVIETLSDVDNTFLSRRELVCNFNGLAGKLKKIEAIDMISKQFKLDGKVVIPIRLKNHVGKPLVTGTFYVYSDENLAKQHVNPTIFARLDKVKAALAKKEEEEKAAAEAAAAEAKAAEAPAEDPAEKPEEKKE